jgi:hypothetical protein
MKKNSKTLIISLLSLSCLICFGFFNLPKNNYDPAYVKIDTQNYKGAKLTTIMMTRSGERIKAKFFATNDEQGKSVYSRFIEWSKGKNIILLSNPCYHTDYNGQMIPNGFCMDNGKLVNKEISDRGSALVIVHATGGIAVSNLKEKNCNMTCDGASKKFNLIDSWDRNQFISCAEKQNVSVFQQHLLVYRNQLNDFTGANGFKLKKRERRFLAVGNDENGLLKHIIIDYPSGATLADGAENVFNFLKETYKIDLIFMINMEAGMGNVLQLYDETGNVRNDIKGTIDPKEASSLLVYYYE